MNRFSSLSRHESGKVARFNQARLRLFGEPELGLSKVMREFDYYDYAHFSKDFKPCLEMTPAEFQEMGDER